VTRVLPVLAAGLLLAGCGGGDKTAATTTIQQTVTVGATTSTSSGTTTSFSVTTHRKYSYPQPVIDNYMQSCIAGDKKKEAYCGCTLDKLSTDVSVQDFARVGLSGGKLPPRINTLIRKAALACVDKL
jgi:hypothetical protein